MGYAFNHFKYTAKILQTYPYSKKWISTKIIYEQNQVIDQVWADSRWKKSMSKKTGVQFPNSVPVIVNLNVTLNFGSR